MAFTEMVFEANKQGWHLLNCFQLAGFFRVNLQYHQPNGATTNYFSEYAEGDTPEEAFAAAWERAQAQMAVLKKHQTKMPKHAAEQATRRAEPAQDKRIAAAMDKLWIAVKNGTRSRDRTGDL